MQSMQQNVLIRSHINFTIFKKENMRKFRIEFLLSAIVEVEEDLPKDELMGQLYHALDLNKYKFNGFDVTNFRGESNVIKDDEVDNDEEKEHPEKPIPLAELDDDEMDQV